MNLRNAILQEHSKAQTLRISEYAGAAPTQFAELMTLFLGNEYRVTQRAAWAVAICSEKQPQLLHPWLKKLITNLSKTDLHAAVKRNTLRILQYVEVPRTLQGMTVTNCFILLRSATEPIAVKVFAMTVLSNVCKKEPGLIKELKLVIEAQLPQGSAGFLSRARKVLRELSKFER